MPVTKHKMALPIRAQQIKKEYDRREKVVNFWIIVPTMIDEKLLSWFSYWDPRDNLAYTNRRTMGEIP